MTRCRVERREAERGAVLVAVLCALMGLSAVAMAVALLATVETRIVSVTSQRVQAEVTARAAIEAACAELDGEADWNAVLAGGRVSDLLVRQPSPMRPGWGTLNPAALTAALQRRTDARSRWGADTIVWRLYLHGALADRLSNDAPPASPYVLVWVADDEADADGRPEWDSNGLVSVRAEAFGGGHAHAAVIATVRRRPAGVELISWRAPG